MVKFSEESVSGACLCEAQKHIAKMGSQGPAMWLLRCLSGFSALMCGCYGL